MLLSFTKNNLEKQVFFFEKNNFDRKTLKKITILKSE